MPMPSVLTLLIGHPARKNFSLKTPLDVVVVVSVSGQARTRSTPVSMKNFI